MSTLVLSTLNSVVEQALTRNGNQVISAVPFPLLAKRQDASPDIPFMGVQRWNDLNELQNLAYSLDGVNAVMTVDEQCVAAAAFIRDTLGIPGQSYRNALKMTNKHLMKLALGTSKEDIRVARHEVAHSVGEILIAGGRMGYPLILKPVSGFGAIATYKIKSKKHLLELVTSGTFEREIPEPSGRASASDGVFQGLFSNEKGGFIVEQYINVVKEYFCEMVWFRGRPIMKVVAQYSTPVLDLIGKPSGVVTLDPRSDDYATVIELSTKACTALSMTEGFAHCEVMQDAAGEWWFGEAAARPGGQEIVGLTSRLLGYDIHDVITSLANHEQPKIDSEYRYPLLASSIPLIPPGRVLRVPARHDVLSMDRVVDVEIKCKPGDVSIGSHHSTDAAAAFIFFEPSSLQNAMGEMQQLASSFVIDTAA
ncbi:hypothetical protein PV350_39075 [Streptomyces sp. PA03-6a]|nr:hypothetical protein [Streptomyces sp. PA03-6a]